MVIDAGTLEQGEHYSKYFSLNFIRYIDFFYSLKVLNEESSLAA
jgi:hypothetical protein